MLGLSARRALRAFQAYRATKDRLAQRVPQDHRVRLVQRVRPAFLVSRDRQALPAQLALPVRRALPALPARRVLRVQRVLRVRAACRVFRAA